MKILSAATVWLRRIVDIALITLILVVLAGVVLGKIVPLTGRETLAIGGRSMEPAVPIGSAIVVVPVNAAQPPPASSVLTVSWIAVPRALVAVVDIA